MIDVVSAAFPAALRVAALDIAFHTPLPEAASSYVGQPQ
jgi:acetate kinase